MNTSDKLKMQTHDLTAENIAKLAALFPGAMADGNVNVVLLRSYVGEEMFGDEAYEFTWVGKRATIAEEGRHIRKTLRPCPTVKFSQTSARIVKMTSAKARRPLRVLNLIILPWKPETYYHTE
jgi:hypothetical protein